MLHIDIILVDANIVKLNTHSHQCAGVAARNPRTISTLTTTLKGNFYEM